MFGIEPPPAWTEDALCAQTDPEAFFPEVGGSTAKAKAICARCPLTTRQACLAYALDHNITDGIWGGTSPRERRQIARNLARQQEAA